MTDYQEVPHVYHGRPSLCVSAAFHNCGRDRPGRVARGERQDVGAIERDHRVRPDLTHEWIKGSEIRQPVPAQIDRVVARALEPGD